MKKRQGQKSLVNVFIAKLEIGGHIASLHLVKNLDHHNNQNYVTEVLKAWKQDSDVQSDKVILNGKYHKSTGYNLQTL